MQAKPLSNREIPESGAIAGSSQTGFNFKAARGARFEVLVIDDDPDALEVLRLFLMRAGFRVVTAQSADAALERIAEHSPNLVITDYMMPGMNGLALCQHLRSQFQTCDIPVILHTGTSLLESDIRLFDRVIPKPADLDALLAAIRKLLLLDVDSPLVCKHGPATLFVKSRSS